MEDKKAVYAGSFDPITKGHIDIMKRSAQIFEKVIVGVLDNKNKKNWFSADERLEMIKILLKDLKNVEVQTFDGLLVTFMEKNNAKILIRGLRAVSDYEYELQMALTNSSLSGNKIETIFLTASRENLYLSSSIVKEIAINEGDIKEFVYENHINIIKERARLIKGGNFNEKNSNC